MIVIRFRTRLGEFALDVDLESDAGLLAFFGPSGSGKTSIVRAVAGLIKPAEIVVRIGERVLADSATGLFLPPHQRRIGYVFQEGRLFPHLSVRGNLVYGRAFTPAGRRRADFDDIVDLLGIGHLLDKRPAQLSGGEKSRVAIGRALLSSPDLLIMDEPLAALDHARKAEILPYLEGIKAERRVPILYVSHSKGEVRRLADQVALVNDGRIVALGGTELLEGRGYLPD